jgi:hypothetical protein
LTRLGLTVQHDQALQLTKDHVVDPLKRDKNGEEAHAIEKSHLDGRCGYGLCAR